MMFVNQEYNRYKYLVEVSDNYIVLTDSRAVAGDWQTPVTIDIIYQYIEPSTLVIESERTFTNNRTFTEIEVSNNYWDRADSIKITNGSILMLFMMIFFINGLTRIFKKGGIFFGN